MSKRFGVAVITALAVSGAGLLAANPHYVIDPSVSVSSNALTISFKAAGLGTVPHVDFTVVDGHRPAQPQGLSRRA
jgi:hypothetical protein